MSEHPQSHDGKTYWLDKPSSVRLIIIGLVVMCVVSFIIPTAMDMMADPHHHGEDSHRAFDYENIYGFHAFFGFCAYAFIVLTAKGLRKVLMRPEEYYE